MNKKYRYKGEYEANNRVYVFYGNNIEEMICNLNGCKGSISDAHDENVIYYITNAYKENLQKSNNLSIYFDMDGVLAKWYPDGRGLKYPEEILDPRNHYYKDLEPVVFSIELAKILTEKDLDVCIISASDMSCINDKKLWLKQHCPFIKEENIFFSPLGADKTNFIKGNVKKSILIDDYNKNLEEWDKAGGIAIKLLNGINSKSEKYQCIDIYKDDLKETGMKILKLQMKEKIKNNVERV